MGYRVPGRIIRVPCYSFGRSERKIMERYLGGRWDPVNGFQPLEKVSAYPSEFTGGIMKDVRSFSVVGIRGKRDGDIGIISIWPIFDKQDWVNVQWSDGVVETARPGDIMVPDEAAQIERHRKVESRIQELSDMPKIKLIPILTGLARQYGASWVLGGPRYWTKDELITTILNLEFTDSP